ncbi:MAG TPA: metallophosphoesterase [Actinomycetota bacterium]|nr:metallophosphoesterase [Actinomycetota bacterium]
MPAVNVLGLLLRPVAAAVAIGSACVAYGVFIERRWYRLSRYSLPVLPQDASGSLTVLHLSDLHFMAKDAGKSRFLASLPRPDVAVLTGDILGEPAAVETAVAALRPLRGTVASYFVLGSNDYFAPRPLNYAAYFRGKRQHRKGTPGRSGDLIAQLEADGWTYLKNRKTSARLDGVSAEVVGMDDPHIERQDLRVASRTAPNAFGLAVVHSPDPAPELAALGYQLILSGHTHGGQVRFPFVGALVTNSTIPTRLSMGLSRFGRTILHISPGLGTSKYAPFRFLCRPEATLLELTPARA